MGAGIGYEAHGKYEGYGVTHSVPLYFVPKFNFNEYNGITPFIKGYLGYSRNFKALRTEKLLPNGTVENGLYFGVGVGAEYKNITFEISSTVNKGKYNYEAIDTDLDFSKITFSLGYKF